MTDNDKNGASPATDAKKLNPNDAGLMYDGKYADFVRDVQKSADDRIKRIADTVKTFFDQMKTERDKLKVENVRLERDGVALANDMIRLGSFLIEHGFGRLGKLVVENAMHAITYLEEENARLTARIHKVLQFLEQHPLATDTDEIKELLSKRE